MGTDATLAVRPATAQDDAPIARVYNHYVAGSIATFELEPVSAATIAERRAAPPRAIPWLVAEEGGGAVVGYAYVTAWKPRGAYRDTVEATVYVAPTHARRGVGAALYASLLPRVWAAALHAVLAGIALPNAASVALHERFGFVAVGRLREVGCKFGRRIDVGYWELLRGRAPARPGAMGPSIEAGSSH